VAKKFQPFKITDNDLDSLKVREATDRRALFVTATNGGVFLTPSNARKLATALNNAAASMEGAFPTFTDDFVEL
jgi:hypothetical protein